MDLKLEKKSGDLNTIRQYIEQIEKCREIFIHKNKDYGTSWRLLRTSSLIDQIAIKAKRIRSIEEKKTQKVSDGIHSEFIGIINYSILTLIQLELDPYQESENIPFEDVLELYNNKWDEAKGLMEKKNHDYGEAWRSMYTSSFTDLILVKLHRIKQILENNGITVVSEGIDANLYDIINYAVFALIKITTKK